VDQALMTDHLTPAELEAAVVPSRRNVGLLREILEDGDDLAAAKSRAEQRMVRLIRRGGLPKPEVNVCVAGEQFDFVWRRERLIVEYDSLKYHRTPARIANDARKQRLAHDAGFRVDRLTKGDLYREPQRLLGWLARALAQT
jgi:very-short-patch-repair endonuclease